MSDLSGQTSAPAARPAPRCFRAASRDCQPSPPPDAKGLEHLRARRFDGAVSRYPRKAVSLEVGTQWANGLGAVEAQDERPTKVAFIAVRPAPKP